LTQQFNITELWLSWSYSTELNARDYRRWGEYNPPYENLNSRDRRWWVEYDRTLRLGKRFVSPFYDPTPLV